MDGFCQERLDREATQYCSESAFRICLNVTFDRQLAGCRLAPGWVGSGASKRPGVIGEDFRYGQRGNTVAVTHLKVQAGLNLSSLSEPVDTGLGLSLEGA